MKKQTLTTLVLIFFSILGLISCGKDTAPQLDNFDVPTPQLKPGSEFTQLNSPSGNVFTKDVLPVYPLDSYFLNSLEGKSIQQIQVDSYCFIAEKRYVSQKIFSALKTISISALLTPETLLSLFNSRSNALCDFEIIFKNAIGSTFKVRKKDITISFQTKHLLSLRDLNKSHYANANISNVVIHEKDIRNYLLEGLPSSPQKISLQCEGGITSKSTYDRSIYFDDLFNKLNAQNIENKLLPEQNCLIISESDKHHIETSYVFRLILNKLPIQILATNYTNKMFNESPAKGPLLTLSIKNQSSQNILLKLTGALSANFQLLLLSRSGGFAAPLDKFVTMPLTFNIPNISLGKFFSLKPNEQKLIQVSTTQYITCGYASSLAGFKIPSLNFHFELINERGQPYSEGKYEVQNSSHYLIHTTRPGVKSLPIISLNKEQFDDPGVGCRLKAQW